MGRQSKLKVKLGNVHQSTERAPRAEEMSVGNAKPPVRYKHQTKYPKHLHGSQDQFSGHHNLRETLQKFNQEQIRCGIVTRLELTLTETGAKLYALILGAN